ncbi:MAG: hypothetical protein J0G29_05940 [Alphaproteobacteria bacterium]|nr:hypothetical protein [Alphaproteobacteria bacterium]
MIAITTGIILIVVTGVLWNASKGLYQKQLLGFWIVSCLITLGVLDARDRYFFMEDKPYRSLLDDRREHHAHIVSLEKQVLLDPFCQKSLEQLKESMVQEERYLEAGRVYAQIERIRPLSDVELVKAAECLIYGSQGFLVPQASRWLDLVSKESVTYKRAQFLKENFSFSL